MRCRWIMAVITCLAANVWAGEAGWTEPAVISALEANQQGRFTLRLNIKKNVSGCRSIDTFYADYGREGSELMYKTALDALQNQLRVQVYATGGCDLNGYSAISSVRILP